MRTRSLSCPNLTWNTLPPDAAQSGGQAQRESHPAGPRLAPEHAAHLCYGEVEKAARPRDQDTDTPASKAQGNALGQPDKQKIELTECLPFKAIIAAHQPRITALTVRPQDGSQWRAFVSTKGALKASRSLLGVNVDLSNTIASEGLYQNVERFLRAHPGLENVKLDLSLSGDGWVKPIRSIRLPLLALVALTRLETLAVALRGTKSEAGNAAVSLGDAFRYFNKLKVLELDFSCNDICDRKISAMLDKVAKIKSLNKLCFDVGCGYDMDCEGFDNLTREISKLKNIESFELRLNFVSADGCQSLVDALYSLKNLKRLSLRTDIEEYGCEVSEKFINALVTLRASGVEVLHNGEIPAPRDSQMV